MTNNSLIHKRWNYDIIEDVVSGSMEMHTLPDEDKTVVAMLERCLTVLNGKTHLLLTSTDVVNIKASRFSYYHSEKKSSSFLVSKREIVEITDETADHLHSAVSRALRLDLTDPSRPVSEPLSSVKMRNHVGKFKDMVALARRPFTRTEPAGDNSSWQGYISKVETDLESGFLMDAALTEDQPTHGDALPTTITVTSQSDPHETLWVESVAGQPVLVKIIYATVSIEKVNLLFRRKGKKIRIIRDDVDEGHRSESHFFALKTGSKS